MSQPYQRTSEKLSLKRIMFNNFIGGMFWALGATIGLSLILTILGFFAKNVDLVPVVGDFVSQIIEFIYSKNPQF